MIEGSVVDTLRTGISTFSVLDSFGNLTENIQSAKKLQAYKSEVVSSLGLYEGFRANIVMAGRFYNDHMTRHKKMIYGNSFYHTCKPGLHKDIIYTDFRAFYPTIFKQIAAHIDESYFGKPIKNIVRRKIEISKMGKGGVLFTKEALKKPLVDIEDLAMNAVKIDCNDGKPEMVKLINSLSDGDFADEVDKRVSKITRNALCYGLGYRNSHARINNISALVMFFARKVMERTVEQIKEISGLEPLFAHTDSVMLSNFNTKDMDLAIRTACGLVDEEYFGNTEVIALSYNNTNTKAKWEDLLILDGQSYIGSTVASMGRRDISVKIAGQTSQSENAIGEDIKGNKITDVLFDNYDSLFSTDKAIPNEDIAYLYSTLKYRLASSYENKLRDAWQSKGREGISTKAITISESIKNINMRKKMTAWK